MSGECQTRNVGDYDEDEKEAADGKAFDERRHADDRAADGDEGEPDAQGMATFYITVIWFIFAMQILVFVVFFLNYLIAIVSESFSDIVANEGQSARQQLASVGLPASIEAYEQEIKGRFDRIVPLLQQVSALQHETDFIPQAQRLCRAELGFDLPDHILQRAWVRPLDMRALFVWCVFESHRLFSDLLVHDK